MSKIKEFKPVSVPKGAFNFCRFSIAGLLWIAFFTKFKFFVALVFFILLLSYILNVKNAPLIFIYSKTINKIFPTKNIILNSNAIRFAYAMGSTFSALAFILLILNKNTIGWIFVGILSIMKTSGAFGKCGAEKLYNCLNTPNGNCCQFGKKLKK